MFRTCWVAEPIDHANQRLQHLSQRLMEVQENQRRQLARDLHDDIGQQLTAIKLAALALQDYEQDAETIGRKAMEIAASICVYTNTQFTVETLDV